MQKTGLILSCLIISLCMNAQTKTHEWVGEYYLRGVMETASGFKLNPDSSFQFFYSYGALDRSGEGKWTIKDGRIILNSRPRPPLDFRLLKSGKGDDQGLTIRIVDRNSNLLRYIECTAIAPSSTQKAQTDHDGMTHFSLARVDSIGLLFQWCPDRTSFFRVTDPTLHYFEFGFEPWIAEVFFQNFILEPEKEGLKGRHPLLEGSSHFYERAN